MKPEVTAIIVVRKGSVRVPQKNLLPLGKENLLSRKIRQLKFCKNVSRVVVGSDSDEMLKVALAAGAEIIRRPDFYCDEQKATANDMIKNMCELIRPTDIVVWSHCTNPLLSSKTYDDAIQAYWDNQNEYDSLLSVVRFQEHLWGDDKKPLNYNPYAEKHIPAKELPPYYMQDGGIFIQPYEQMLKNHYFFGKKPYLFEIPDDEFLDINNKRDYLLAKAIIEEKTPKNIIARIACLGQFCLDRLDVSEFNILKFPKNRIDYSLNINKKTLKAVNLYMVEKYLTKSSPERTEFVKSLIKPQELDIFHYTNVNMIIMDSYSELTDKLFVSKKGDGAFCCHYRDVDISEQFKSEYLFKGLLPIDEIKQHYDNFFAKINSVYGDIPILFLIFPSDIDPRPEYKMQCAEICNAVTSLSHKYKNIIALYPDIVEPHPTDKSPYHFSQNTYNLLAEKIVETGLLNPNPSFNPQKEAFFAHSSKDTSKLKKYRYYILSKITFGKKRNKYKQKYIMTKVV